MNRADLDSILAELPRRSVAVLGDFCLDRYLVIDPKLTDISLETGLAARQVTEVRASPGGAANVLANLRALGVGRVRPLGFIGLDGEGFELAGCLERMGVDLALLRRHETRRTPTYVKPVVLRPDAPAEEQGRLDLFPRQPLSRADEDWLASGLAAAAAECDALIVSDYTEPDKPGAVTPRLREAVAELGRQRPALPILADSRLAIGAFRGCSIKPNEREALALVGAAAVEHPGIPVVLNAARQTAGRNGRPAFVTLGERGMVVATASEARHIPAFPLRGAIDTVGAGDSAAAAIAAALAAGAAPADAALLGVLASSIICQQIGTTGTASPEQVRARFADYAAIHPDMVRR
ncbi:MAG TPA: PfkB family carbohydrate kinase [Planctomycetota bacterium]|nr:PfkB family carbohydrate kinase [Planctomycetota bacterium]